ncbi:hypothetical protein N9N67_07000 [Bacteriovoracaceae bacterium]|nr:hypothetical protein [Bacteriovoracaceae bacterium]
MKHLLYLILIFNFNLQADQNEEEIISESAGATQSNRVFKCVIGYKDAIKKHEISLVQDQSEEICRKIHESGDNYKTKEFLQKTWSGANFFTMYRRAQNKTDNDILEASCKAGAFMALGPIEDSLKMKKLTLSVAVHEICVGPIKEGESIRRFVNRDDKSLSEEYFLIRKDGKFIKHGALKQYYKNMKLSLSSNYKNGELDGTRTYFEEDGKKREVTNYKMGKKSGPYKRFLKGEKLIEEGSHKEGKQNGLWKYYKKGKLTMERDYKMGKVSKTTEYNND